MHGEEEARNVAVVRRTLAGYGRVPLALWLRDYAPDLVYEEPGQAGGPMGLATLQAALARQFAAHPEITFSTDELLAMGDRVIATGTVHLLQAGRTALRHQVLLYTLEGGLIRRLRVYTQGSGAQMLL